MESVIKKLGKTSITVEKDYHSSKKEYNKLTVVEEQGAFKTYLSRKPVPVGIEITNREYWIPFSGIKESLIIDYEKFKKEINNNINSIVIAYLIAHPELIVNIQNKSINIPKLAEDVINWFNKLQTDIDTEADRARLNEQHITEKLNTEADRAKEVELNIQKTLENITKTGEASAASNVTYIDNIEVGSTNLQDVIDKVGTKTLNGEKKLSELGTKVLVGNEENVFINDALKTEISNLIYAITDVNNRIIFGIHKDGSIFNTKLNNIITELLNNVIIDKNIKINDTYKLVKDAKYVYAITDKDNKVLFGIKLDGSVDWFKGIPEHIQNLISKNANNYIIPENNSNSIQKSDYILKKGVFGIHWQKTLIGSDNHFAGIQWMLNNLDISCFRSVLNGRYNLSNLNIFYDCIKIMNERNIPVKITCVGFPEWKGINSSITLDRFLETLDIILSCDGKTPKILSDGSTYNCLINETCFLDEVEDHIGHTPIQILELLDMLVTYTREKRPDILISAPSSGRYDVGYHQEIGSIRLPNGKCFSDLFDNYDIDVWVPDIDSTTKNILYAYAIENPMESYNKTMSAIVGFSTLTYTQEEQAELYFKHTLKYLSYGASDFTPFSPDYLVGEYYILEPVISNASHLYLRQGDNNNLSIVDGDGYDDIIVRFGSNSWTSDVTLLTSTVSAKNFTIVSNLQAHGLYISGSNELVVTKVTINSENTVKSTIWTGSQNVSSSPLVISSSAFNNLVKGDTIVISTNASVATGLTDMKPRKAALALKYLDRIINKGCTRPVFTTIEEITICMWNDESGKIVYVLWADISTIISLETKNNCFFTDIYGNVINIDLDNVNISSHPIIIKNSNGIKIK